LREIRSHAHDDKADHAGLRGAGEDGVCPFGEVARVEVAVCVGESEHGGGA
jgi:hypothetical protein